MFALNVSIKNSRLAVIKDAIDAAQGAGKIMIYTAPVPDPPGSPVSTQTLLAELTFSKPCGSIDGGVLTFSTIQEESNAPATGTAAWARITDGDGNWVADVDVGDSSSSAVIKLNTTQIYQGGIVRITSASIAEQ